MSREIWRPTADIIERANVTRLMRKCGITDYRELVRRTQEDPEWFWPLAIEDVGLAIEGSLEPVVDVSQGIEWARWFPKARVSIAWNCVHRHAEGLHADEEAVVGLNEDGSRDALTFRELSREVIRFAEALVRCGIRPQDRVGFLLPMGVEAAIASQACAHMGAIQVPIFSGFPASAVAERVADSEARAIITADGTHRRGKELRLKETVDEALEGTTSVEHVIVKERLGNRECPMTPGRDMFWEDAMSKSTGSLEAMSVNFEHPYLIAYTSGTTGKPKGTVHVQGGFLVKFAAEVAYQADVHPSDRVLFATDLGWIMGPWTIVGAGALGAAVVLMEGAADWPKADRLWTHVGRERITTLGLSPTLVRSLIPYGTEEVHKWDRSSLRSFVTTGEPWDPASYRWLFNECGQGRVPVINVSGGTEAGSFLSCTHVEPIKECSLGFPALGMAVDCVDANGESVAANTVGELICTPPWPSMTRGFWGEQDRYLETYWRKIPGVWVHGDFASVDEDGYWYLHGRSDDTLKVGGKRIGPLELEAAALSHPAVLEAAAVGMPHKIKGEVPWLVCVLTAEDEQADRIAKEIESRVIGALGKPFRPEEVIFVKALPKTRSQKIVRRAVKAALLGADPGDLSAVENPHVLNEIVQDSS